MVDSPQTQPGLMDQISGVGNEFFGDAVFGSELDKLANDKPDLAKEILASMDSEAKQLIDKNGQINRDALRKNLTLMEKFSLMAKMWIAENLSDTVMDGVVGRGKTVETTTFADTYAGVKVENQLNEKNIYWPTTAGNMGMATMLWNLKGQVEQGDGSKLKFMTGSTLVMPMEESGEQSVLGLDISAALQIGLLKHGINLKTYEAKEFAPNSPLPGDKEIQVVFAPAEGLPMKADQSIDVDAVKNFAALYQRGQVQWFSNPLLMAGVLTSIDGNVANVDAIMTKFGLSGDVMKGMLTTIITGVVAPAPAVATTTTEATAPAADAATTAPVADATATATTPPTTTT